MLNHLTTIRSHTGLARFLANYSEEPTGWLARIQTQEIPSPYRYSPVVAVYRREQAGENEQYIVWFETKHKQYEVFTVSLDTYTFDTAEAAEQFEIDSRKEAARSK